MVKIAGSVEDKRYMGAVVFSFGMRKGWYWGALLRIWRQIVIPNRCTGAMGVTLVNIYIVKHLALCIYHFKLFYHYYSVQYSTWYMITSILGLPVFLWKVKVPLPSSLILSNLITMAVTLPVVILLVIVYFTVFIGTMRYSFDEECDVLVKNILQFYRASA